MPDRGDRADARPVRAAKGRPTIDETRFIPWEEFVAAFAGLPPVDYDEFRADIDAHVDPDPTPRDWPEP